ncbi:hypothetical protein [Streptomyces sp. NPDC058664]
MAKALIPWTCWKYRLARKELLHELSDASPEVRGVLGAPADRSGA